LASDVGLPGSSEKNLTFISGNCDGGTRPNTISYPTWPR
jgi:hypothetical protein